MHESVHVNIPLKCTRTDFGWANTLFVSVFEYVLGGVSVCHESMERGRIDALRASGGEGVSPMLEAHLRQV